MRTAARAAMVFALFLCPVGASLAEPIPPDTRVALIALFAASNEPIVPGSSCDDRYEKNTPITVKEFIATPLSYLYGGKNWISGSCRNQACFIQLYHADGKDDVFVVAIQFQTKNGKARAETIECRWTP